MPDHLHALQSLANCTTLALESERFEHVCASLRTEWSSCAEYHGLFNVAMDMELKNEVNVLLKGGCGNCSGGHDDRGFGRRRGGGRPHGAPSRVREPAKRAGNERVHGTIACTQLSWRSTRPSSHTRAQQKEGPNFSLTCRGPLHCRTPQQFCDWCVL